MTLNIIWAVNLYLIEKNMYGGLLMKILYRLRFVPLILSIVFLILSILGLFGIFSIFSIISLPYQDPTPEMLERQMEDIYLARVALSRSFRITIIAFCATISSFALLFYLRYKRKRAAQKNKSCKQNEN